MTALPSSSTSLWVNGFRHKSVHLMCDEAIDDSIVWVVDEVEPHLHQS